MFKRVTGVATKVGFFKKILILLLNVFRSSTHETSKKKEPVVKPGGKTHQAALFNAAAETSSTPTPWWMLFAFLVGLAFFVLGFSIGVVFGVTDPQVILFGKIPIWR